MKKKIIAIHLRDDYSGSPRVLKEAVSCLSTEFDVEVWAGGESNGILADNATNIKRYFYCWSANRYMRLLNYLTSQIVVFFKVLFVSKTDIDLIYINTLLPFGAAVAAKLRNIPVLYHIHEVAIAPKPLMSFLVFIASMTADEALYVSNYHSSLALLKKKKGITIHNSLPKEFAKKASLAIYSPMIDEKFVVLMVASQRDYKGIYEFLEVAELLRLSAKHIVFQLVFGSTDEMVSEFRSNIYVPSNVEIFSQQDDLSRFYRNASLVLNLSRPDQWIETFGLTILEAMAYGVPVIAPPVGGPVEIVNGGKNGYLISCYDMDLLASKINELSNSRDLCLRLSVNARETSHTFSHEHFSEAIIGAVHDVIRS